MRFFMLSLVLLTGILVGCGPTENPVAVTPPAVDTQLRTALMEVEKSGEPLGSGGMVIQEGIDTIRAQDPAKASALDAEFQKLAAANNPGAVRSAAKAMLDKLK